MNLRHTDNSVHDPQTRQTIVRLLSSMGGAKEISRENIDKLLDLRESYYHVSGRHPGYEKCDCK